MKDDVEERINKIERRNKTLGITLIALVISMIIIILLARSNNRRLK